MFESLALYSTPQLHEKQAVQEAAIYISDRVEMDKFRLPNTVDFHLPSVLVGRTLSWNKEKGVFEAIKADIDIYYGGPVDLKCLMKVVDDIDQTKVMGNTPSMRVLGQVMSYLRIKLLSRDVRIIEMTAVMLDVLVKNCQYRVHIYVGRKIFMKTFCLVFRLLLADERERHRCVGIRMLDILQGWGEAFSTHRREIYPHIVASYSKTRYKYGIQYPRPDYDPTRVPIFLGPINDYELLEAHDTNIMRGLFERSSVSGDNDDSPRGRLGKLSHQNDDETKSRNDDDYSIDSLSSGKYKSKEKINEKLKFIHSDLIEFDEKENHSSEHSFHVRNINTNNDMIQFHDELISTEKIMAVKPNLNHYSLLPPENPHGSSQIIIPTQQSNQQNKNNLTRNIIESSASNLSVSGGNMTVTTRPYSVPLSAPPLLPPRSYSLSAPIPMSTKSSQKNIKITAPQSLPLSKPSLPLKNSPIYPSTPPVGRTLPFNRSLSVPINSSLKLPTHTLPADSLSPTTSPTTLTKPANTLKSTNTLATNVVTDNSNTTTAITISTTNTTASVIDSICVGDVKVEQRTGTRMGEGMGVTFSPSSCGGVSIDNSNNNNINSNSIGTNTNNTSASTVLPSQSYVPAKYYSTAPTPYYGGITRGIVPSDAVAESESMFAVLNTNVHQLLIDMKIDAENARTRTSIIDPLVEDFIGSNKEKEKVIEEEVIPININNIGINIDTPTPLSNKDKDKSEKSKSDKNKIKVSNPLILIPNPSSPSPSSPSSAYSSVLPSPPSTINPINSSSVKSNLEECSDEILQSNSTQSVSNRDHTVRDSTVRDSTVRDSTVHGGDSEVAVAVSARSVSLKHFDVQSNSAGLSVGAGIGVGVGRLKGTSTGLWTGTGRGDREDADISDSKELQHHTPMHEIDEKGQNLSSGSGEHGENEDGKIGGRRMSTSRGASYVPPSSDPTVEVKYFGHQRVVIKKH